jgi:hypothetical protein
VAIEQLVGELNPWTIYQPANLYQFTLTYSYPSEGFVDKHNRIAKSYI